MGKKELLWDTKEKDKRATETDIWFKQKRGVGTSNIWCQKEDTRKIVDISDLIFSTRKTIENTMVISSVLKIIIMKMTSENLPILSIIMTKFKDILVVTTIYFVFQNLSVINYMS